MTTSTMSINRALTTLKHQAATFKSELARRFVDLYTNGKSQHTADPIGQSKDAIEKNQQSIVDQIEAVFNKRKAINDANQTTKITIAGREMTIADALIFRAHAIPLYEQFLSEVAAQQNVVRRQYGEAHSRYENVVAGLKDPTPEEIQRYKDMFEPSVFDNRDNIESIAAFVKTFKLELDGLLSEINSITQIQVD